jgi:hypothetical protein
MRADSPRGRLLELADRLRCRIGGRGEVAAALRSGGEVADCLAAARELAELVWRELTSQPVSKPDGTPVPDSPDTGGRVV